MATCWHSLLVVTILGLSSSVSRVSLIAHSLSNQPPLSSRQRTRAQKTESTSPRWQNNRAAPSIQSVHNSFSTTALFQSVTTAESSSSARSKTPASETSSKPRFVIEKIGGGSGKRGVGASSHASYYYGEYIKDKVYQDISNLCVQSFFGTNQKEIQQRIQSSTQKMQLYESLQPEELRRRRDDVKTASEFFVAYELREATPEDMKEYHREQEIQRQRMQQEQERRRGRNGTERQQRQVHFNGKKNDHYYRVDHHVKSPANMASGYEPYSNRRQNSHDDESPVVMGGTLGGIAGRRHQQAKSNAQRPLKRYQPEDYRQSSAKRSRWKQVEANENRVQRDSRGAGRQHAFPSRRSYDFDEFDGEFDDPFYNPYTTETVNEPMVMGGNLGPVGPATRKRQRRTSRGAVGPLFAHRRFHQHQPDFDYYQQARSAHQGRTAEQPFMVQNEYTQNTEPHQSHHLHQAKRPRRTQPPMPHEATAAHTYSSNDEINFEYHYNPNMHQTNVKVDGLPLDDAHREQRRPRRKPRSPVRDGDNRRLQDFYQYPMGEGNVGFASHYPHAKATGDALEEEAPMYVKGPMVGFVEIVHTPYSLGVLDNPEMLTAGMKPHRPVLRNLVIAEHAQNSGIDARLLQACERHVQTHWQMKELVVEVDDLWNAAGTGKGHINSTNERQPNPTSTPNTVDFYLSQGYEIALSDPETNRYDEKTGEIVGQIQCRRDVLRKEFEKNEETTGVTSNDINDKTSRRSSGKNYCESVKSATPVEVTAAALDVEYMQSISDDEKKPPSDNMSFSREDIHDCGVVASVEAELITDPSDGPRAAMDGPERTVTCDPEGPNSSIFDSSSTKFE